MRIYLGCTVADLAELWSAQELDATVVPAHAVTGDLRRTTPEADEEELEYTALMAAARSSLTRLASRADSGGASWPARRVVLAADVSDAVVRPEPASGPSGIAVSGPVHVRDVAAVHVDDPGAADAVRSAATTAASGENRLEDVELLWYATQEIPDVLAGG